MLPSDLKVGSYYSVRYGRGVGANSLQQLWFIVSNWENTNGFREVEINRFNFIRYCFGDPTLDLRLTLSDTVPITQLSHERFPKGISVQITEVVCAIKHPLDRAVPPNRKPTPEEIKAIEDLISALETGNYNMPPTPAQKAIIPGNAASPTCLRCQKPNKSVPGFSSVMYWCPNCEP